MVVKSVLQGISGLRTSCVDPQLAQSIRYIMLLEEEFRWSLMEYVLLVLTQFRWFLMVYVLVLTQLKVVLCFKRSLQMLHFYTVEGGGLFQVFLVDDDFYTAESGGLLQVFFTDNFYTAETGGLLQVFLTDDAFLHF